MSKLATPKQMLNPFGTKGFGSPFALVGGIKDMGSKPNVGTPTTYAPPAPPTAANAAAVQASADARRKAGEKQGIASTLLSDSKSGSDPTTILFGANPQKNSLLGGG